ncbi:MAG: ATP-binding protein [Lewinellaceae bacterium]|nr:ATP-binding protein [Lewinellaceae bacterium]
MKTSQPAHPFAKIKDLWLEVANCDFYHSHLEGKEGFFLGRRKAKEHLKMLLRHSKSQSGAYLVTGYRGMGKTSLVHSVLKELT